jgi:cyclohexa-1,5-dienecarbonyl-CoA hydratase
MLEFPAPILAAVRGQCLGGGLEVALATTMIFATPDATLGQPEMKLGVFAPAASCLLPHRVGQAAAEDLLFSGRTIGGAEAKAIGLVDFDAHLAPRSAAALAFAIQAVRAPLAASVASRLADVERLYVNALMKTRDANEGIAAFLAKRQPSWEHR